MRVTNVLAPIDFSPPSKLALDYGVAFARAFHANLTLLHVVDNMRVPPSQVHTEDVVRRMAELLSPEDKGDLDVRIITKSGAAENEILSTIREENVDLVVLGTHGRGILGRALIGSVTEKLLRKLSIPVLTVCHAAGFLKFGRILFATDLSEASESAFKFALDLTRARRSDLTILHALNFPGFNYGVMESDSSVREQLHDLAKAKLDDLAAHAAREGVKAETMLVHGHPAERILEADRKSVV